MTVTFAPAWRPGDPIIERPEPPGWDAELDEWDRWHAEVEAAEGPRMNVSNANAGDLLRRLHLPVGELVGEMDAGELIARIYATSRVRRPDPGTETVESGGPGTGQAHVIDCGRRPGYIEDRLGEMLAVAEAAQQADRAVTWA